ncbi:MAG: hypothetical protein HY047_03995 [Acidobacteria bacterium]|nr:hypothetical protein [Acidobacteriota bacterium]
MITRARHLHDDRLVDCYLAERHGEALDPPVAEHLSDCESCGARYLALSQFMDALRDEADAETDALFTPERLRAQQQQIARRLAGVGRPARVISFPRRIVRRTITASTSRMAPRWVAATAAAGLFVGVALGAGYEWGARVRTGWQGFAATSGITRPPRVTPIPTRVAAPPDVADDAFLSELEIALERPHTRELQAFDAFTPHVREISDQSR